MSIDTGYAASTGYKLQGPFAGLENHFQWMCSGADVGPVSWPSHFCVCLQNPTWSSALDIPHSWA